MKYSWKSHKDRNRHKNRIKWSAQARLVYVKDMVVGFYSLAMILGEYSTIHSPPAVYLFIYLFIFEVELLSRALIPLIRPGSAHSGSASWDDCGRMFLDKLRVSSFPDRFLQYTWTAAVSPLRLRWDKGVGVFRCNLPPALFGRMTGVFYVPLR